MNKIKKSWLLSLLAGMIIAGGFMAFDSDFLRTSILDSGDKNVENTGDNTSTPKFSFRAGIDDNKNGGSYDFGLIKAGTLLNGKAELSLVDPIKSSFFISAIAASSFEESDSVKSWLRVPGGNSITLNGSPDGMRKEFDFQVQVPENLLAGDYSIMIQAVLGEYEGKAAATGGVRVRLGGGFLMRFAIEGERIYEMALKGFSYNPKLLDDIGDINIFAEYQNNGNTILTPRYNISVTTGNGVSRTANEEVKPCDPGEICTTNIAVQKIEGLKRFDRVDVKGELTYRNPANGAESVFASFSFTHYIVPWSYIAIGLGIFALLISLIFFFRGRKLYLIADCYEYKVLDGDTLEKISSNLTAEPKKIILANGLKSPFFLSKGSTILIPNSKNAQKIK